MAGERRAQKKGNTRVRHVVAVGSGKGGVGKSSVALLLAAALRDLGQSVGIIDADIYGPSLVAMTGAAGPEAMAGNLIVPPQVEGVRLISAAMMQRGTEAFAMRGPMISRYVTQFFEQVAWGSLDVLLVDLPPGTGDVMLTVGQVARVAGAIVVTTPQHVSEVDALRAVDSFNKLAIDVVGVVENMSTFVCPTCTACHRLFPGGAGDTLVTALGGGVPLYALGFVSEVVEGAQAQRLLATPVPSPLAQLARDLVTKLSEGPKPGLGRFSLKWRGEQRP